MPIETRTNNQRNKQTKKLSNKQIKVICLITSFVAIMVLVMVIFITCDPTLVDTEQVLQKPSWNHPFGTDQLGRDMLIRTVHGFVHSFVVSLVISLANYFLGCVLGSIIGYYGGVLDVVFYQVFNFFSAFPSLVLIVSLVSLFGAGMPVLMVSLIVTGSLVQARLIRNEVSVIRNNDYIYNLKILGASDWQIVLRHILPHALQLTLPLLAMNIGHIMLTVSGYSFLGFGLQPPRADIGVLLKESVRFINRAPHLLIYPGLFQIALIFLLNQLTKSIQDVYLVRQKKIRPAKYGVGGVSDGSSN